MWLVVVRDILYNRYPSNFFICNEIKINIFCRQYITIQTIDIFSCQLSIPHRISVYYSFKHKNNVCGNLDLYCRGCPEQFKTTVFPSTAHDTNKQYVCVTLEVNLPPDYPDCEPAVRLRNPRGLDDSMLNHISDSIKEKCSEYLGQPVIFELIEVSNGNISKISE